MKKTVLLASIFSAFTLGAAQAGGGHMASTPQVSQTVGKKCQPISKQEVARLFDRWNAALKVNPDAVTANYRKDALLLPTLSNKPRDTHPEIRDYFVNFLAKGPTGIINKRHVRVGCNVAFDGGIYTFEFKDGTSVTGRYSYTYEYENGQWLIASHHSSGLPQDIDKESWQD